ncbi:MAG: hypothetical protein ACD_54C00843G0002 [uncultured bacterium]|nr:MAG: hypothetical protein ACD_54C00843G0002 [uncultured bacterium]
MRRGPDHPLDDLPTVRPLHRKVMQLIGRRPHHHLQPQLFGLLAQPDAAVIIAADPAEVILPKPEQGAIVDHAAMFVAHRGIDHLTHRQLLHITGQTILQQSLGIRAGYLKLPQWRQIQHHGLFAAGPVFLYRAVLRINLRQPVALVFDHIAGLFHDARMEGGFLGHHRLRSRGRAVGDGPLERLGTVIGADVNIRKIPAICGRGIIRASRVDTNNVGQRPQQNVIAGAAPRLVRDQHAMGVNRRIEEQVDRHPAGPRRHPMFAQGAVEIVGTIGVAGIADVVVVLCSAGHCESIVAAHSILHHFDQRQPILIVIFRMQARHRIGVAHEGARGGHIQRVFQPLIQLAGGKALKIRTLAAIDVDDLDVVAGFDEIAFGGGGFHPQIQHRGCQRVGQVKLAQTQQG